MKSAVLAGASGAAASSAFRSGTCARRARGRSTPRWTAASDAPHVIGKEPQPAVDRSASRSCGGRSSRSRTRRRRRSDAVRARHGRRAVRAAQPGRGVAQQALAAGSGSARSRRSCARFAGCSRDVCGVPPRRRSRTHVVAASDGAARLAPLTTMAIWSRSRARRRSWFWGHRAACTSPRPRGRRSSPSSDRRIPPATVLCASDDMVVSR